MKRMTCLPDWTVPQNEAGPLLCRNLGGRRTLAKLRFMSHIKQSPAVPLAGGHSRKHTEMCYFLVPLCRGRDSANHQSADTEKPKYFSYILPGKC